MNRSLLKLSAIMLCLIAGTAQDSQAQLFKQDFAKLMAPLQGTSSTSVLLVDANYVSATPSNAQFTSIAATAGGTPATQYSMVYDSTGSLVMARIGGGNSALTRSVPFAGPPTSLVVKFDYNNMTYTGGSAGNNYINFNVGTTYPDDAAGRPQGGFAKFGIGFAKPDSTWFVNNINSGTVSGAGKYKSMQTITFVVNNSGGTLTYASPGGSTESVANQMWDLWVGTTKEFDEQPVLDNTQTLSCFKLFFGSASSTIRIDNLSITQIGGSTSVKPIGSAFPGSFNLSQNFPNPFNPSTRINFTLAKSGFTTLKIYSVIGTEVATLVSDVMEAGSYNAEFDASNLPSGVYMSVLTSGGQKMTNRMMLLK